MSTEPAIRQEDEGQKQSLADRLIPDRLMPNAARLADAPLIDELTDSLDRTRKLLSGDPEGAAAAAMNRFSGEKEVETRIALALSMNQPLADPERFLDAHRLAMRALEVLDREGFRRPSVPNLGPLTVVAEYLVENVTEYIVKSYAQGIIGSLRRLYARREVQTAPNSPERRLLASARNEIDRIVPDFTGGGIGAPVLVAGGLLLPFLASLSQFLGAVDVTDKLVQFGGIIIAFVLFFHPLWRAPAWRRRGPPPLAAHHGRAPGFALGDHRPRRAPPGRRQRHHRHGRTRSRHRRLAGAPRDRARHLSLRVERFDAQR